MRDILFSVNSYDRDGDCYDSGIFLHFDNTRVKIGDLDDFKKAVETINGMMEEVEQNWESRKI